MSFSSIIKDELCHIESGRLCCTRAEIASVYAINSAGGAPPDCLITENAAFARRAYSLLKELHKAHLDIGVRKNKRLKKNATYIIHVNASLSLADMIFGEFAAQNGDILRLRKLIRKKCCKKAALRGAFLAGGSISDPEKLYHLEIYCKKYELARYFSGLMADFELSPKITERTDYCVVYVKDSEKIVDFLNLTGAHRALMALENTRIIKDMRNSVNRAVNCETANLEKTINASLRQIANILYIKSTVGFEAIPKGLREIAELRETNREISLKELGQLLSPPLGKSGVNHRLRKLDALAETIREKSSDNSVTPIESLNQSK